MQQICLYLQIPAKNSQDLQEIIRNKMRAYNTPQRKTGQTQGLAVTAARHVSIKELQVIIEYDDILYWALEKLTEYWLSTCEMAKYGYGLLAGLQKEITPYEYYENTMRTQWETNVENNVLIRTRLITY